jgi:tetratricopeptide (TPR) repeat protein
MLAEALYSAGSYEEAETFLEQGAAASPDDAIGQVWLLRTSAKLTARRGESSEAELLARKAVAIVDDMDSPNTMADTLLDLAEILKLAGRHEEATGAIAEAIRLYEEKGNVVMAKKTRALLEELTAEPLAERE